MRCPKCNTEIFSPKKWGRPKGTKQSEETKNKISEAVKQAYKTRFIEGVTK